MLRSKASATQKGIGAMKTPSVVSAMLTKMTTMETAIIVTLGRERQKCCCSRSR